MVTPPEIGGGTSNFSKNPQVSVRPALRGQSRIEPSPCHIRRGLGATRARLAEDDHLDRQLQLAKREQIAMSIARPPSPDNATT